MIRRQCVPCRLIVFDNASTDGTTEAVQRVADTVVNVPAGEYVPGRVLNCAMDISDGELVVFVNSDCTPCNKHWLAKLLAGFTGPDVAAVFGRQLPRENCKALFARDTESTFGDGHGQAAWRHCFSMAAAGIRRSVWLDMRFNEALQYSEDIEWTWRASEAGYQVRYIPQALAVHSENYSLAKLYRRQYGEGKAEATIFPWSRWRRSVLRYSLMPCTRQVLGDIRYCLGRGAFREALNSPVVRAVQSAGRLAGLHAGLREAGK